MRARHILSLAFALAAIACSQSHESGADGGTTPPGDAGPPGLDAGLPFDTGIEPGPCDGLGPAACLAAGCAPDFDDSCCPQCEPTGACADCVHPEYHSCQPYAAACLGGPSCGTAPTWGCGPTAPQCDGAHVVDLDTCSQVGCVPAYPSGEGDPDPATAICVPIEATSCTVSCRRIEPPCPTGTRAEGDGFCYTDRCIPAFVCE